MRTKKQEESETERERGTEIKIDSASCFTLIREIERKKNEEKKFD